MRGSIAQKRSVILSQYGEEKEQMLNGADVLYKIQCDFWQVTLFSV